MDSTDALRPTNSPSIEQITAIAALEQGWVAGFYGESIKAGGLNSAIIFRKSYNNEVSYPSPRFSHVDGEIEFQ